VATQNTPRFPVGLSLKPVLHSAPSLESALRLKQSSTRHIVMYFHVLCIWMVMVSGGSSFTTSVCYDFQLPARASGMHVVYVMLLLSELSVSFRLADNSSNWSNNSTRSICCSNKCRFASFKSNAVEVTTTACIKSNLQLNLEAGSVLNLTATVLS